MMRPFRSSGSFALDSNIKSRFLLHFKTISSAFLRNIFNILSFHSLPNQLKAPILVLYIEGKNRRNGTVHVVSSTHRKIDVSHVLFSLMYRYKFCCSHLKFGGLTMCKCDSLWEHVILPNGTLSTQTKTNSISMICHKRWFIREYYALDSIYFDTITSDASSNNQIRTIFERICKSVVMLLSIEINFKRTGWSAVTRNSIELAMQSTVKKTGCTYSNVREGEKKRFWYIDSIR